MFFFSFNRVIFGIFTDQNVLNPDTKRNRFNLMIIIMKNLRRMELLASIGEKYPNEKKAKITKAPFLTRYRYRTETRL
jgi:hypothetical protein